MLFLSRKSNWEILQVMCIPMGINPGHFWTNLCLSKDEYVFMNELIKKVFVQAENFHGTLLMIFVQSMMQEIFKSNGKKCTARNWN